MVEVAITVGLALSLFGYELFGLSAGGLVVPGYVALQMGAPLRLVGVLGVSLATSGVVRVIANHAFIFGRRQMVLCVLVGSILAIASRRFLIFDIGLETAELQAIGWVVPGLIAHWFLKQGVIKTLSVLIIVSTLTRLIAVVLFGGALLPQ